MRFAVDCMLGKLAKWLKILGFDTLYFNSIDDDELLHLAKKEKRILLTKDNGMIRRSGPVRTLYIRSEDWPLQVDQVLEELELKDKCCPYSRCITCNIELRDLPRDRARNLVTPYIFEHGEAFALCPECGRVYWKGTHHGDMEAKIGRLLKKKR